MEWAEPKDVLKHFRIVTEAEALMRRITFAIGCASAIAIVGLITGIAYYLQVSVLILLYYCIADALFPQADSNDALFTLVDNSTGEAAGVPAAGTIYRHIPDDSEAQGETEKEDAPVFQPATLGDGTTFSIVMSSPALSFYMKLAIATTLAYSTHSFLFNRFLWQRMAILFVVTLVVVYILTLDLLRKVSHMEIADFPKGLFARSIYRFWRTFAPSNGYHFIGMIGRHRIGLPPWMRFLHVLIAGPTGSQKSTSQIIPQMLFDASAPGSAVGPDAKSPQLFVKVAGRWIAHGKKAFLFDAWHPDSVCINPLLGADDKDLLTITTVLLQEREEVISEESFWKSRTRYLLYAILRLVQTWGPKYANLATVYHLVQSVETLLPFIRVLPAEIAVLFSDFVLKMGKESQMNALTSIRDKLDIFMDGNVRRAFSRADFTLDMLFKENDPCLLMLGAPVDHKDAAMKINSLVVNLIVNMAFRETRLRHQQIQAGTRADKPNPLYLYLDELRSLKVSQLPDLVSIARDTRTQIICSTTDLNFFKYYGHDMSSLMSNLRSQIYFGKLDIESCKYISSSLGRHKVAVPSWMRGVVVRQEEQALMDPAEVQNKLKSDELIVFTPVTAPFICHLASINTAKWIKKMEVPCPSQMKPYYEKWGLPTTPPEDPVLPRVDDLTYDLAALYKGVRPPEMVRVMGGEETHHERGGGKTTVGAAETEGTEPPKSADDHIEASSLYD